MSELKLISMKGEHHKYDILQPTNKFMKICNQNKDKFIDTQNEICFDEINIGLDYVYEECKGKTINMSAYFQFFKISDFPIGTVVNKKILDKASYISLLSPTFFSPEKKFIQVHRVIDTSGTYFELFFNDRRIIFNEFDNNGYIFPYVAKKDNSLKKISSDIVHDRSIIGFFCNGKLVNNLKSGVPYELRYQNFSNDSKCFKIQNDKFLPVNIPILNPSNINNTTFLQDTTVVRKIDTSMTHSITPEMFSLNQYPTPLVVKLYLNNYFLKDVIDNSVTDTCSLDDNVCMVYVKGVYNNLTTNNLSTSSFPKYFITLNQCLNRNDNTRSSFFLWFLIGLFIGAIILFIVSIFRK